MCPGIVGDMDCPIDGTQLTMSERQGIEIDYCPKCRGVWLDRGELDKIIERADQDLSRPSHDRGAQSKPKKKKNMLSELFELGAG